VGSKMSGGKSMPLTFYPSVPFMVALVGGDRGVGRRMRSSGNSVVVVGRKSSLSHTSHEVMTSGV
jgi:hypothetical protein